MSYSGGGRITLRLLNVTTGEVVMSDSFDHQLASADPSTLPRVIDGKSMAAEMMNSMSARIGGAIVTEIFPISVVSLNGDQVVLSQGGESLAAGQRWEAVFLGEELKDPQTGRSLGRDEVPIGAIRIDRVSSQTSYGTLEDGTAGLSGKSFRPGAIALRKQSTAKAPAVREAVATAQQIVPAKPSRSATAAAPRAQSAPVNAQAPATPRKEEEKW